MTAGGCAATAAGACAGASRVSPGTVRYGRASPGSLVTGVRLHNGPQTVRVRAAANLDTITEALVLGARDLDLSFHGPHPATAQQRHPVQWSFVESAGPGPSAATGFGHKHHAPPSYDQVNYRPSLFGRSSVFIVTAALQLMVLLFVFPFILLLFVQDHDY